MRSLGLFATACAVSLPLLAGEITGHVLITKKLTKKSISLSSYDLRGTTVPSARPDLNPVNEFERTVVMLEGGNLAAKPPVNVVIDQQNARFDPDLVVIPVGSSVRFPNSDPIFHNVFSLSPAHSFDLGYYSMGKSRTVKFDRTGVVQVYCHIHSNMYAAIVVTSSPIYGKPSADGSFTWSDVPPGHYRVVAWHKIAGLRQSEVDVPEKGSATVTIRIPVEAEPKAEPKP